MKNNIGTYRWSICKWGQNLPNDFPSHFHLTGSESLKDGGSMGQNISHFGRWSMVVLVRGSLQIHWFMLAVRLNKHWKVMFVTGLTRVLKDFAV